MIGDPIGVSTLSSLPARKTLASSLVSIDFTTGGDQTISSSSLLTISPFTSPSSNSVITPPADGPIRMSILLSSPISTLTSDSIWFQTISKSLGMVREGWQSSCPRGVDVALVIVDYRPSSSNTELVCRLKGGRGIALPLNLVYRNVGRKFCCLHRLSSIWGNKLHLETYHAAVLPQLEKVSTRADSQTGGVYYVDGLDRTLNDKLAGRGSDAEAECFSCYGRPPRYARISSPRK